VLATINSIISYMEKEDYYNNYSSCTVSAAECKCFDKLTSEQQQFLEDNSVIITYKKNETINKQGALVSHIMYMEEGLAKVYMSIKDENLLLKLIPPHNFIGLVAASENENVYQYSSMAYVESKIRQIEVSAFRKLLNENSDFAKEIINILSANSVQIYNRFFCLIKKHSYGRLADIILCLAERIFYENAFSLPISRQEIAELAGMRVETVIRILKEFSKEGLIKVSNKEFEVLDYEQLRKISDNG